MEHEKCFNILKRTIVNMSNETSIKDIFIYLGAWGVWDNDKNDKNLLNIKLPEHTFNLKKLSIEASNAKSSCSNE